MSSRISHHFLPPASFLPFPIVLILFHCLPASHPARYTSPSLPPASIFHPPLAFGPPSTSFSLSARYGRLRGGRAIPDCVPGRGCPGARAPDTQLPPAADHLVQGRPQDSRQQPHVSALPTFVLREVGCWSVLSLRGKVYFIFQYSFFFFLCLGVRKVRYWIFFLFSPPPPTQS